MDHAFGPEYARRIGCLVEEIFIAQPDDGPMALEIVDALVRSGAFDLVVLDSVPGLYSASWDDQASAKGNLREQIIELRNRNQIAPWIVSHFDCLRVFGNEAVHTAGEMSYRPPTLREQDLVAILASLRRVLALATARE